MKVVAPRVRCSSHSTRSFVAYGLRRGSSWTVSVSSTVPSPSTWIAPPSLTSGEGRCTAPDALGHEPGDPVVALPRRPGVRAPAVEGPVDRAQRAVVADDEGRPDVAHPEVVERRLDAARSRPRAGGGPRRRPTGRRPSSPARSRRRAFATAAQASRASSADAASSPSVFPTRGNAIHTRSCGAHSGGIVQVIVFRSLAAGVRPSRIGCRPRHRSWRRSRRASALFETASRADSAKMESCPRSPP